MKKDLLMKFFSLQILNRLQLSFLVFLVSICGLNVAAGNYTVKRGQTLTLRCTAQPPANGWISHVFFNLVNPEDAQYIGINYNSADCYATVYGLKTANNIAVEVTYAYSFRGSYDNTIHVGHGTYVDYITVEGPRKATSFKFREGEDISVPANGSTIIHVDFSPTGSEPDAFSFGFINTLGQPFDFTGKTVGTSYDIQITGRNKPGSYVYLAAYINDDTNTVQTAKLTIRNGVSTVTPTSIALDSETITLSEGKSEVLSVRYLPDGAWMDPTFISGDSNIASVDETGKVTAKTVGSTTITVEAGDLKTICQVRVLPKITGFNVESVITINAGFSYTVKPTPIPAESQPIFNLSSSDKNIFTVSGMTITGIRPGTAKLTVKSPEAGTNKDISVTVKAPESGMDIRQATQRVQTIKQLFYKTLPQ